MNKNQERYECKCTVCGKVFWACKSIFQEVFGWLDSGSGSCPQCKTFLNLTFDEKDNRMIVTPWDEYMKGKGGLVNSEQV